MEGELAAQIITAQLYPNRDPSTLTNDEKSNISALTTLAAGLAGGVAGNSLNAAGTGAVNGKVTVENNYLSEKQKTQREEEFEACKDGTACKLQVGSKWDAIDIGQQTSYGAGMLIGVPAGLVDSVQSIVNMGLSPVETYDALKSLFNSGDVLGNVSDAVKQSYITRLNNMEAEYQKAGASGSFNAGVEGGKLISEIASLAAGGAGVAKGGAVLVEKVAAKVVGKAESAAVSVGKDVVGKTTSVIAEYGPLNKGPLPDKIASTFRSGTYKEVATIEPTTLYRVYGGSSSQLGPYWTTTKPSGPVQSIIDSALDPKWGNTATNVVEIKVPTGSKFYEGIADKQAGLVGGGNQVFFLDRVDPSWIVK